MTYDVCRIASKLGDDNDVGTSVTQQCLVLSFLGEHDKVSSTILECLHHCV